MAYLAKKIEDARVVWFEASNQWAILDEPKWFVFQQFENGKSRKNAYKELCRHFSFSGSEAEAIEIVKNVYESVEKLKTPDFKLPDFRINTKEASHYKLNKKKTGNYRFCNKPFSIVYGSPHLERYIHLPLAHLEEDHCGDNIFTAEVFPFKNKYVLRTNKNGGDCLSADEAGQIKRLLYVELANYFYDKKEDDWMAFVHASALEKNGEVFLLTSPGGGGKSTLSGLLQLNGFGFFSDDFVPILANNTKAYPFPAALCVKNDSISMLSEKGMEIFPKGSNKIAYAKLPQQQTKSRPCEVKRIIFVKYNPDADLDFHPISTLEALALFHPEAWVGNDMKRAEQFINWFENLYFYKLEYGNNVKAIEMITNLAEQA